MKVQDLKIGNWVQFRHTETPVLITLGDFVREYKEEHLEDYEPIPLTEEWLERFGIMQNTWFEDGSYMIKEDRGFGWEMYVRNAVKTKRISFAYFKHVHQLQNLYFALTGQELQTDEIKKKVNR